MSTMPSDSDPVTQWIQDLCSPAEYEDAARHLFDKYDALLKAFVAKHIAAQYNAKFGASDVVQEGLFDFFQRRKEGQYEIRDRAGLLAMLKTNVLRKAISAMREADAQKRSPESLAPKPSADPRDDGSEDASSSGQWGHELQLSDHHDLEAGQKIVEPQKINRNYRKSLPVEPPAERDSSLERDPLDLWLIGAAPHLAAAIREKMAALDETDQQLLLLYCKT
jgi:hypothetical protein